MFLFISVVFIMTTGFILVDNNLTLEEKEVIATAIATVSIIEPESKSIGLREERVKAIEIVIEEKTEQFIKDNKIMIEEEKKSNNNITNKPFEITNLTEKQFNKILKGTGLEGQGGAYKQLEEEHGVNGVYAISVAFLESGYGKHKAGKNNFYGMKGNKGWMSFNTPEDNIMYFGELMNRDLYRGKSIDRIAKIYCPPNYKSWVSKVNYIMGENYNKI